MNVFSTSDGVYTQIPVRMRAENVYNDVSICLLAIVSPSFVFRGKLQKKVEFLYICIFNLLAFTSLGRFLAS